MAAVPIGTGQREMRPGVLAVGPDSRQRVAFGLRPDGCHILPSHARAEQMADRKQGERLGIIWINGDRLIEQSLRREVVLTGNAPVMRQRPHDQIPGIEALGRLALSAKILRRVELRFNRGNDGLGDLVLNREHIGKVAVVTLSPEVAAGRDVVKLSRNAYALALLAHAALDHIVDTEFLGDLLQVNGFALVGERGVARDHEEPAQLGQRRDDVFADAVGKYSCSASPLMLAKGSTAIAGRSEDRTAARAGS